ncbi:MULTISPECIES: complement resistance protein TraT [Vibrio]|uniref:Complement resistance protein TraT n=2 Tax=Vibrio TaxID=662 RepID=A0A7X4RX61_9VIBR|nr:MULTISPECIES: complement resistance protein TraT [Vibrio]MBF9003546.1 complement resistance protein TraT [Vibrio nitrifigilis]MZI96172.1 complement resistance protein TraT [Vibrio eleionomae]
MTLKKFKSTAVVIAAMISLSGCSAMSTAIQHRNLVTNTKMSATVWLDPTPVSQHTVYLQLRNSTNKKLDITKVLTDKLKQKGYTVTSDPAKAHYWLQTNIIKLEKMDPNAGLALLNQGYGGAVVGGGLAALAMASHTHSTSSVVGAGLIGSAIGFVADNMVEDVNFGMVTDVQVVEKTKESVDSSQVAHLNNGIGGSTNTTVKTVANKKRYQTRILSSANKVNLDYVDAEPALVEGLATSVAGIF